MPKVDQTLDAVTSSLSTLQQSATERRRRGLLEETPPSAIPHGRQRIAATSRPAPS
jgi:hypothetical protein